MRPRPEASPDEEPWIYTPSGVEFRLNPARPEDVRLTDIAHGLAFTPRFQGLGPRFYSVLEHSVLVHDLLHGQSPTIRLQALLHDAAEAYLGDVARPLKGLLPDYRALEARVHAAIVEALAIPQPDDPLVKAADTCILWTEIKALFPHSRHPRLDEALAKLPPQAAFLLERAKRARLRRWRFGLKAEFLRRHAELSRQIPRPQRQPENAPASLHGTNR